MWYWSSSSSSRSTRVARKSERRRSGTTYSQRSNRMSRLRKLDDERDSRGETLPGRAIFLQLAPAGPRERVEFRAAVVFARSPFGGDPSFLFQLVQRRIERAIAHLKDVAGYLFEPLADGPSVQRFEGDNFQNQQVQGALHQIGRPAHQLSSVSEWKIIPSPLG